MADHATSFVLVEHDTRARDTHRYAGAYIATLGNENTRRAYRQDLRSWLDWCALHGVDPLDVQRVHVDLYARDLESLRLSSSTRARRLGTLRCFYEYLIDIEVWTALNPARKVRQPHVTVERQLTSLSKRQLNELMEVSRDHSGRAFALVTLMGLNLLRVFEACGANIADLGTDRWHDTLLVRGKGGKNAVVPLPPPTREAISMATAGRDVGPIVLNGVDRRMRRDNAARLLGTLCRRADIPVVTPHGLRRTGIRLMLAAGVPLREVQLAARHSSPMTTTKYDADVRSLDQHPAYVLMREIA